MDIFGPAGEFWLGLENIHAISKQGSYILQVELTDGAGRQLPVARYRLRLDGEEEKFSLHLEEESSSGVQEKVMSTRASGLPFSTVDRDNDLAAEVNCAELLSGATSLALRRLHSQTDQQRFKMWVLGSLLQTALLLQVVGGSAAAGS